MVVGNVGTIQPNVVLPQLVLLVEVGHFVVPIAMLLLVQCALCPYCWWGHPSLSFGGTSPYSWARSALWTWRPLHGPWYAHRACLIAFFNFFSCRIEGSPCSIWATRDIPLVTLRSPATFWSHSSLSNLMVSVQHFLGDNILHTTDVSHKGVELQPYGPDRSF